MLQNGRKLTLIRMEAAVGCFHISLAASRRGGMSSLEKSFIVDDTFVNHALFSCHYLPCIHNRPCQVSLRFLFHR